MKKLFKRMMFNAPLRAKQADQNSKKPGRARKKFFGKIILKKWGVCLPLFDRGCFVFFFL